MATILKKQKPIQQIQFQGELPTFFQKQERLRNNDYRRAFVVGYYTDPVEVKFLHASKVKNGFVQGHEKRIFDEYFKLTGGYDIPDALTYQFPFSLEDK